MTRSSNQARPIRPKWSLLLGVLALGIQSHPNALADDGITVTFDEMPTRWSDKAVDLCFSGSVRLYTIQAQANRYSTIRWERDGITGTSIWDCARYGGSEQDCWSAYDSDNGASPVCTGYFCQECHHWDIEGNHYVQNHQRPFVGASKIDSLPNGDVVITPKSGSRGLGLYKGGHYLELYTVCVGFDGGTGEQTGSVGIYEFDLGVGSYLNVFSLGYPVEPFTNGSGPTGRIVGAVDLGNSSGSVPPRTTSRRGSGTGGTGPYPGVDARSNISDVSDFSSIGLRTATADFDGDGWDELVLLHPEENSASVLPLVGLADYYGGDGNLIPSGAVFGEPIVPQGIWGVPSFAGTGDFDGNGTQDLIIWGEANWGGNTDAGTVHFGNGTGGFSNERHITTGTAMASMEEMICADLNGDGIDEVVFVRNGLTPTANAVLTVYRRPLPPYTRWWNDVEIPNSNGAHVMAMDVRRAPGSGQAAILLRVNEPQATLHAWAEHEPHLVIGNCSSDGVGGFTGRCCFDSNCSEETEAECNALGGSWGGTHTKCENNNCDDLMGICCVDSNCSVVTEPECNTLGGLWGGTNTTCWAGDATCDYVQGACCLPGICIDLYEETCLSAGGSWTAFASCTNYDCWGDCPVGQIEDCNGNCAPFGWVGDSYCDDGTYEHNGVAIYFNCDEFDCDGGDCTGCGGGGGGGGGDGTGTCCVDSICAVVTEAECNTLEGSWGGANTTCTYNYCGGDDEYCAECGHPSTGSCFTEHDWPFCDNPVCCEEVCAIDPSCCTLRWDSACAELADSNCWGWSTWMDTPLWRVPDAIANGEVTAISLGSDFTLAMVNGELVGWGSNSWGQCEVPEELQGSIRSFEAARSIGAFAVDYSNNLHYWGHPDASVASIPPEIQGNTLEVNTSANHAIALLTDGSVVCWGNSDEVPETLGTIVEVKAVYNSSMFALDTEGVIVAWGSTCNSQSIPQSIQGQVVSFDATCSRGLALLTDGSMVEWSYGEIQQRFSAESLGEVRSFQADKFILTTSGKVIALRYFPGGPGNVPADCTLLACGSQHAVALGRKGSVSGVLAQIELDPVGNPDITNDGIVDGADLAVLLGAWGATGPADLDQSGEVDGTDLMILLSAWGSSG